eukprot:scaffold11242_cov61-Phaeocystis_antarctica.AAC.2
MGSGSGSGSAPRARRVPRSRAAGTRLVRSPCHAGKGSRPEGRASRPRVRRAACSGCGRTGGRVAAARAASLGPVGSLCGSLPARAASRSQPELRARAARGMLSSLRRARRVRRRARRRARCARCCDAPGPRRATGARARRGTPRPAARAALRRGPGSAPSARRRRQRTGG